MIGSVLPRQQIGQFVAYHAADKVLSSLSTDGSTVAFENDRSSFHKLFANKGCHFYLACIPGRDPRGSNYVQSKEAQ